MDSQPTPPNNKEIQWDKLKNSAIDIFVFLIIMLIGTACIFSLIYFTLGLTKNQNDFRNLYNRCVRELSKGQHIG